jgi:hypothetical protein
MTHTAKWILGLVIVLVLGIAFCILIVVGFAYYLSTGDRKGEYQAREAEGRELGKTTDQAGCMKEGLARARGIKLLEINRALSNQAFVEECLGSARSTAGFCDGVPESWKLQDNEWSKKQCERLGMDELRTSCTTVFRAKANACQRLK